MEVVLHGGLLCCWCKNLRISSASDPAVFYTLGDKERQSCSFSGLPIESMKGPSFLLLTGEDYELMA